MTHTETLRIRFLVAMAAVAAVSGLAVPPAVAAEKGVPVRAADGSERGRISGPVLGYVPSGRGRLQAVVGVPGAALYGPEWAVGSEQATVYAAPDQKSAVAVHPDAMVVSLPGERSYRLAIPGISPEDKAAYSPSGTRFAIFSSARGVVVILGDLLTGPTVVREIQAGGAENPKGLAIGDPGPGEAPVVAWSDSGAVRIWNSNGAGFLPLHNISTFVFSAGTSEAVAADEKTVWLVRNLAGAATLEDTGLPAAAARFGLGLSQDRQRLFAAGSEGIVTLDMATRQTRTTMCDCPVDRLERLSGNAVFRLNAPGKGPLYILDGDQTEARVLFVPAAAPALDRSSDQPSRRRSR